MEDIWQEIVNIKRRGGISALATIVKVKGSTPRAIGAKMLIRSDGSFLGTLGGGCLEASVWQVGMKVLRKKERALLDFDLTGRSEAVEGLICGGTMQVLIEPILP